MPIAHQQGYTASGALGNATALWASSFYDLSGGALPHQQIKFWLNKLAGWAAELAAHNLDKP